MAHTRSTSCALAFGAILALIFVSGACSDNGNTADAGRDLCACMDILPTLDTHPDAVKLDATTDATQSDAVPDQTAGDAVPDGAKGCVPACGSDEVCVQYFDGTCQTGGPQCIKASAGCLSGQCTTACEKELCPSPYQCQNQVPCGTEQGATLYCYGP